MTRDLPTRMYRHGRAFRLHLKDGQKVNLGREYATAMARYHELMGAAMPVSGSDPKVALAMWRRHKKGAAQRGLAFTITPEDISTRLRAQRMLCAVTGLPFRDDRPPHLRIRPWAPSVDRLDGREGYTPTNIRIVCAFVNVAMNGFGEQFFALVLAPLVAAGVAAEMKRIRTDIPVGILSVPVFSPDDDPDALSH